MKQTEPQQVGTFIDNAVKHSNAPLWAGLRAYRAERSNHEK
jgi:hypothetical protein